MTKIKTFTLSVMILLGGFVLSTPFDALAAEDTPSTENKKQNANANIQEDIQKFIADRLVESGQDGKITKSKEKIFKNIEEAEKQVDEIRDKYNTALGKATDGCKDQKSVIEKLFPKKTQILHELLGKNYSWSYHVNEVITNAHCPDMTEERATYIDEARELGEKLDNARYTYQQLEKLANYEGDIYSYYFCPQYEKDGKTCATALAHFDFIIDDNDGTLMSIAGTNQGCVPLPFRLYEAKSCLICPLMDVIYKAIQTASTNSYDKLGKPLSTLVLIGLAIWIAFMVLQNVSSMTKQDAPKFLTDLFKNSFKVIIIYLLLRDAKIVYGIIIGPILKAGFELGVSFLSVNLNSVEGCSTALSTIGSGGDAGVLPQYVYANINCFIRAVQYELAKSQAIGQALMCVSTHQAKGNLSAIAKFMPDFLMMLQGGLIYLISFIMTLAFGFYLIDATVQLGIFGTILPFLLLCWPFKKTNSYFQKGVGIFMNSWFVYVFMGVVVNVCMNLIAQSLTGGKGGFTDIENAINGNDVTTLKKLLDIGYSGFLLLVACCVMAIKLMQKVEEIAGKFSGGLGLGIGAKIGGLATSGATGGTKAAASFIGNRAKGVANARIFGEEGKEKSVADMWRSGKHAVGRGIVNKIHGAGKWVGQLGGTKGHR